MDNGVRDYVKHSLSFLNVVLWEEKDELDDIVPDIVIFAGDKMGMDAGIEYINDTTAVIVEENEGGSLKRRNTSPIHAHAGVFNDFVYLDDCKPTIIVYSNVGDVITQVSVPQTEKVSTDLSREDIVDLGKRTPYYRPADFPIEVEVEMEEHAPTGDFPNPSGDRSDWFGEEVDES